jgi:hypothetical protein
MSGLPVHSKNSNQASSKWEYDILSVCLSTHYIYK